MARSAAMIAVLFSPTASIAKQQAARTSPESVRHRPSYFGKLKRIRQNEQM